MVIQGGAFDLIRDLPTLLELCGAAILSENGKYNIQFELLGENEPLKGLIKYEELRSSKRLGYLICPRQNTQPLLALSMIWRKKSRNTMEERRDPKGPGAK